jgi:hypothetical protein
MSAQIVLLNDFLPRFQGRLIIAVDEINHPLTALPNYGVCGAV